VDLLKMDIEGAEFDVLMTCPPDALERVRRIAMEFHNVARGTKDAPSLAAFLRTQGYEVEHTAGGWNGTLTAWRCGD
jgi:hypothetical protein